MNPYKMPGTWRLLAVVLLVVFVIGRVDAAPAGHKPDGMYTGTKVQLLCAGGYTFVVVRAPQGVSIVQLMRRGSDYGTRPPQPVPCHEAVNQLHWM